MNSDLSTHYRRLHYLQQWINLSIDNRIRQLDWENFLDKAGIGHDRILTERLCIYEDFEGFCECSEQLRREWLGIKSVTH